jgi:chemotaxis protein methyltransferase CheR
VTPHDYEFLRKLLKQRSGLTLSAEKHYLVESRLLPVARRAGASTLVELVAKLKGADGEVLTTEVVEAMTTNETFFFRDKIPFEQFRADMIPALIAARGANRSLRIWCAACSTGQEPYTLAMIVKDMAPRLAGWRIEIIGTDISNEVLQKARTGIYSQFEVQRGLPIQLLVKHFTQVGEMWQVSPDIRAMVQYRPLNLLDDFASLGQFDIVFCRNVLIYFEQATKIAVLDRLARVTAADGYLVLGAAETVIGLSDTFRPLPEKRGLYAPKLAGVAPLAASQAKAEPPKLAVVAGAR